MVGMRIKDIGREIWEKPFRAANFWDFTICRVNWNSQQQLRHMELVPSFLPYPFSSYQERLPGVTEGKFSCQE